MDRLSDWLDRQIVVIILCNFLKREWEVAGSSFSVGLFLDFAHQKGFCSPKITTDFKKAGSSFSMLDYFSYLPASLTVIECIWHFSVSCAGILSVLFWMILPIFNIGQIEWCLVAEFVPSHQRAFLIFLFSSMHTTGAFGDLSAFMIEHPSM